MRSHLSIGVAAALLLTFAPASAAQSPTDGDAVRLRTLFFQRDFETGVIEGAKLTAARPNDLEVKAWFLIHRARTDDVDGAMEQAKQMVDAAPQSGWAWLARAASLHYKGERTAEAIAAAEKALSLMPGDPTAIWFRAQTLAGDAKRREEVIAFVDAQRSRVKNPAELLTAKAYALYMMSSAATPRDEALLARALDTYAEARRLDPSTVNAHYMPAQYLNTLKRSDEAYELLKKAVTLAPGSKDVHQAYWTAIQRHPQLTAEEKNAQIEADLAPFLENHGNRPGALLTASYAARDLKQPARQQEIENRILQRFNDSREAEWVLIGRMREFRTPELTTKPEYRQMLRDYVARPKHYHLGLLGETYRQLFFNLVEDTAVSSGELLRVADGMTKHETTNVHISYVGAAIALADKKIQLQKAEEIARASIGALRKRLDESRWAYKTDKEFEDAIRTNPATGYDAIGWVLFAQGRLDEAESELLKAYELSPGNVQNLFHLGRFYETKKDIARAEEFYVKGLAVQTPGKNPSEAALHTLYEKRHGSADGYDAYLGAVKDRDRVARKDKVLAARIASPSSVTPFTLKSLDGKPVSLDSLKGKIVVVNFWGIWCGWCVKEMPDLQKLYEKYAADPDVAILTIDNDQNPGDVPPWMKQKGFTFPVLLDDGYVEKVVVHVFPTTWFLDREGRKVFEKVGWSEKLVEEFSWRVEAIR